jgi:hypothetical protein
MTAEIIQFGSPRVAARAPSRQIVPITASRGGAVDMLEEREARDTAWRKARAVRTFYERLLHFVDGGMMVWQTYASEGIVEQYRSMVPLDWDSHHAQRDQIVALLTEATARLLLQPAAYSQHASWKETHLRNGWPLVDLSVKEIERAIAADKAFLEACPRKRGGYRRGRDT